MLIRYLTICFKIHKKNLFYSFQAYLWVLCQLIHPLQSHLHPRKVQLQLSGRPLKLTRTWPNLFLSSTWSTPSYFLPSSTFSCLDLWPRKPVTRGKINSAKEKQIQTKGEKHHIPRDIFVVSLRIVELVITIPVLMMIQQPKMTSPF